MRSSRKKCLEKETDRFYWSVLFFSPYIAHCHSPSRLSLAFKVQDCVNDYAVFLAIHSVRKYL